MHDEGRVGPRGDHGLGLLGDVGAEAGRQLALDVVQRLLQAADAVAQVVFAPVRDAGLRDFLKTAVEVC